MGVNGSKMRAPAPSTPCHAQHSCCTRPALMTLGSIRPDEGALSTPLVWSRVHNRPSGPDFAPCWQDATFQGPVISSALACPTSTWWSMTPFLCADGGAQLRPPAPPPAWQEHDQQWDLGPGHFTPFLPPKTPLIWPRFRVIGARSCAPFSP